MTTVSVIIVNFNAGDRILRCLGALMLQTRLPDEIILADNGSTDGSLEAAAAAFPSVRVLALGENTGFAAANNRAVEQATGTFVALLNPDAYPEPPWLEALLAAAARYPAAAAFGSTQIMADDPSRIDGAGDCLHALGVPYRGFFGWRADALPPEGRVIAPCAAAALYRRDAFLAEGGFDERFFCYCEDVDLGIRLYHSGLETIQVRTAVVLHEGSALTGRQSAFTVYHGHRNRVWLFAKAMPPLLFWSLLPAHLLMNLFFVAKFAPTPVGEPYRRGIIDGLRAMPALRRERQGRPTLTSRRFARLLVWSPLALIRRRGKITA